MNGRSPRVAPHWTVPAVRQNALLLRSGRVTLLLLSVAAVLLVAEAQLQSHMRYLQAAEAVQYHPTPALVDGFGYLLFIGLAWALLVWWNEGKASRPYHAAMPVDAAAHDLCRIVAGMVWLMVGAGVFCAVGAWLAVLDDTHSLFRYHPALWLNAFTLPLLMYLPASIIALRTDWPLFWLTLLVAAGAVAVGLNETPGLEIPVVTQVSEFFIESKYGLHAASFGGRDHAYVEMANRGMHRAFWTPATPREYLIANAIWLALTAALVGAAARWRR